MRIRPARAHEAELLGSIAFEAKAYWKYDPELLATWREALVPRLEPMDRRPAFVAEEAGVVAGFCQVVFEADVPDLDHLWVRPAFMGRGCGRALLERACATLAERGYARLHIDAEPNAEAFYRHCGARREGAVAAPIAGDPGRVRPQMTLVLAPPAPPCP